MYSIFSQKIPIITLFFFSFCLILLIGLNPTYPEKVYHKLPNLLSKLTFPSYPAKTSNLGINLNGIADWSTELPFLDAFKSSRPWITQCVSGETGCSGSWDTEEYDKLDLDEQGWVKSLPAPEAPPEYTRVATLLFTGMKNYPAGKYVVLYDGEGTIEYKFDATKDEVASRPGRDVINVTPSGASIYLIITSTDPNHTGNYIRNIRLVQAKYEDTYESELFNPELINKIKKFQAIRFMDWMETNHSKQGEWANRPKVDDASYAYGKGVPVEIMVKLANRIGADPWFNMPHQATDDYITNFAKIVKDTLDPNLTVYVELSNEVWNWQFQQANYALAQGQARWGKHKGDAYMQWYGMRTAQMSDIWKNVFGSDSNKVVSVMATHTVWLGLENAALDCPLWVAEGNAPCYQHSIDAFAIAGYFNGSLNAEENESTIESWLNEPDGGVSKAFKQIKSGGLLPTDEDYESLTDTYKLFNYHQQVADKRKLQLVVYEGGQHLVNSDNQKLTEFFIELNRHPEMYKIYTQLLNEWKNHNGGLFMHFSDIKKPTKWGSWGALEHVYQKSSPKYDALIDFIDQNS
ncbi:cellulose-binding protein [Moorena sp. SIOASIH]|uniref:cellulose-binding protein n=1 Tax=Moorena sp. SIOASIH TaxID=2607817 RepID=UPI0025E9D0B0|nr:cellulose-binding protein [Moorena sp. SIOASIH]